MINEHFFNKVQRLHNRYSLKPEYNVFRALRTELDEIRLHSRLLCDLLNPAGSHGYKDEFLKIFLKYFAKRLQLDNFSTLKAKAHNEYKNIDILITSGKTAIVIENKINAEDQPRQLYNYYMRMKAEGYEEIKLIYLTPEGRAPSKQSISGLPKEMKNDHLIHASYKYDIFEWIQACQKITKSTKDIALNQVCSQYLHTISSITNKVENPKFMQKLKNLLHKGDNLENFPELIEAYNTIREDFQREIWINIIEEIKREFGKTYPELLTMKKSEKIVINEGKNIASNNSISMRINRYPNSHLVLHYKDSSIYFGVYCDTGVRSDEYKDFLAKKERISNSYTYGSMPIAKKAERQFNFKNLSYTDLKYLKERSNRQKYARSIVRSFRDMATSLKITPERKQSFLSRIFGTEEVA